MSFRTPEAPAAPSASLLQGQQTQANRDALQTSAQLNAVDTYGPWGQTTYEFGNRGGLTNVPIAQRTSLNQYGQQIMDAQQRTGVNLANRAEAAVNAAPTTPFSLQGVPYDPRSFNLGDLQRFSATSMPRQPTGGVWGGMPQAGRSGGMAPPQFGQPPGAPGNGHGSQPPVGLPTPGQQSGGVWGDGPQGRQLPGGTTVLPYDPSTYGDVSRINEGTAAAMYGDFMRRTQPQFDQQNRRLEQNLENRGIPIGSEAYTKANEQLSRSQNDAMMGAASNAYLQGHQVAGDIINREQALRSAALGQGLQIHNQGRQDVLGDLQTQQNLRGQIIGEDQMVRNQSIQDAAMYLQGVPQQGMPQAPNIPTYQMQAPDIGSYAQMQYGGQMAQYNAAQQRNNSIWSGVGNAAQSGAMLWMMSNSGFKEDIGSPDSFLKRALELPIKSWRYTDRIAQQHGLDTDLHVGPMAEEWARFFGGDGVRIHLPDALFALWKAFQELAQKFREREKLDAIFNAA